MIERKKPNGGWREINEDWWVTKKKEEMLNYIILLTIQTKKKSWGLGDCDSWVL